MFGLLCRPPQLGRGEFWTGGVGLMVDDGGVGGSGRQGATSAERRPVIKPLFCTFLLLSGLRWKKPKRKTKTFPLRHTVFHPKCFSRTDPGPLSLFNKGCFSMVNMSFLKAPKSACDIPVPTLLSPGANYAPLLGGSTHEQRQREIAPLEQLPVSKLKMHNSNQTCRQRALYT